MEWKPVVIGVDKSPESVAAVHLGWQIARAAGTQCRLIHAVGRTAAIPVLAPSPAEQERLLERVADLTRQELVDTLSGHVPADAFRMLELVVGNPTWALGQAIRRHAGGLLVLGGKHHGAVARWLGGSTAHHAIRTIDVPIVVTWSPRAAIRRILVAVDLSYAARPVVEHARSFAQLFDSRVRVLHALEPIPFFSDLALTMDEDSFLEDVKRRFQQLISDFGFDGGTDLVTRRGFADSAIRAEAEEWDADLVVLGTHGSNWVDRILVGSTTDRLLNRLPTSLLVVPVAPRPARRGAGEGAASAQHRVVPT